jgi:hypothetical protein
MKIILLLITSFINTFCDSSSSISKKNDNNLRINGIDNFILGALIVGGIMLVLVIYALINASRAPRSEIIRHRTEMRRQRTSKKSACHDQIVVNHLNKDNSNNNNKASELPNESNNNTVLTANKTLGISDRPFLEKRKIIPNVNMNDMSMSDDGSNRRRMEHQDAEASFKLAISNADNSSDDNKIKELAAQGPKYQPNKVSNVRSTISDDEGKTTKDIVANNICNYTEGKREDFYTEGSQNSYEDDHGDFESKGSRRDSPLYKIEGRKRQSLEEQDMTPQEHSDFLDGDDYQDKVIVQDNYNSEVPRKEPKLENPITNNRKRNSLNIS